MARISLLVCLLIACGGDDAAPTEDASVDGGVEDARSDAAEDSAVDEDAGDSGVMDSGLLDAALDALDAGPLDPATCPVGPADGCCPLSLRYGGTDPDCASFDCATATFSEPVVMDLDDPAARSVVFGGAGVSWTGDDLIIGWADRHTLIAGAGGLWIQRRDPSSGALRRGPIRRPDIFAEGSLGNVASLAWSGRAAQALFVAPRGLDYGHVLLDDMDRPTVPSFIRDECGPDFDSIDIADTGERFLVTASTRCLGNSKLLVVPVSYEGVSSTPIALTSAHSHANASAFDPRSRRMLLSFAQPLDGRLALYGRFLDVDTLTLGEPFVLAADGISDVDVARVGFDGERFGILYSRYSPTARTFTTRFGVVDPEDDDLLAASQPLADSRRLGAADIAWNGSGWSILTTITPQVNISGVPATSINVEMWLYRMDARGALIEAHPIGTERTEPWHPALAFAGDTVAITWTQRSTQSRDHMLVLLSCEE